MNILFQFAVSILILAVEANTKGKMGMRAWKFPQLKVETKCKEFNALRLKGLDNFIPEF